MSAGFHARHVHSWHVHSLHTRHFHLSHHAHAVSAHGHGVRRRPLDRLRQNLPPSADQVHHIVPHGIHGVVRLVAVKRPVARSVGDEVDGAYGTHRNVGGRLGELRSVRYPAAIGAAHREVVPMHMHRVGGHGEIAHPDAHAIVEPHWHDINGRKDPRVARPDIEVSHLSDLRQGGAGVEPVGTHDEDEVPIGAAEVRVLWVDDDHAHHAHGHLHHLIGMGVVHEGTAALEHELVDEGPVHRDVRL